MNTTVQAIYCTNLPSLLKVFVYTLSFQYKAIFVNIPANEVHA